MCPIARDESVVFRTREKTYPPTTPGQIETYVWGWYGPSYASGSNAVSEHEHCTDTTQPPPFTRPRNWTLVKKKVDPLRISGLVINGHLHDNYKGYNPLNWTSYGYCPPTPGYSGNYFISKALASINPYRPIVDLPLFIFELRELPGMLRDIGRVKSGAANAGDVPGGYLAYQFGWAPLLGDLAKLIGLGESIQQRMDSFRRKQGTGEKVRVKLGKYTSLSSGVEGATVGTVNVTTRQDIDAWATAIVRLVGDIPSGEVEWEALKSVLGLGLSASTIWNMLPWSFLIDYMTNVGAMLEAQRGYSRWAYEDLCVMVHAKSTQTATGWASNPHGCSFSGGIRTTESKARYVTVTPLLGFGVRPWLSGVQRANLGALATADALRSVRASR